MYPSGNGYKSTNQKGYLTTRLTSEFIIDETQIKVGSEVIWLWIATIESETKNIFGISISKERKICL